MSSLSTIKTWLRETDAYRAGSLYREDNFPLNWLVRKVLSKVRITDETAAELKALAEKGVVIYALKSKSQLNSLILRELSVRRGIPPPVYCHGINMIVWQPFPMAIRLIASQLYRWIFRKERLDPTGTAHLQERVGKGQSAIIHLGQSELFDNPFVDETLSQLLEAQANSPTPLYLCPEVITYGRRREKEEESFFN
nr:hypothetical protein [Deltaproteobacteria bacterium]